MIEKSSGRTVLAVLLGGASAFAWQAAAAQDARASDNLTVEEVVVTAQRREEGLQSVPVAVAAFTPAALQNAGARDVRDLQILVPNLQFRSGNTQGSTSIFLRGVGINDFNASTTGAVGVYVDDVFVGINAAKTFNLFDTEAVEVLKGPQGTLYGRNTTGGAIKFTPRGPTEDLSADARASYGRFDEVRLEGGVGGPLVGDRLKARIAGFYLNRDGYVSNRLTGRRNNALDLWGARLTVDWTPTDDWLIRFSVNGGESRSDASQYKFRGQIPDGAGGWTDLLGYHDAAPNPDEGAYDVEGREKITVRGGALRIEKTFDWGVFTSITAGQRVERDLTEDADASPNAVLKGLFRVDGEQLTQEFRLQSGDAQPLTWSLGAFYFRTRLSTDSAYDIFRVLRDPATPGGGFDPGNLIGFLRYPYEYDTESVSVFGQADYAFSDRLKATLGLRYTRDKVDFDYRTFFDEPGFTLPILAYRDSRRFDDLSYRLALSYRFNDDVMAYASASRGFNGGGFPGAQTTDAAALEPYRSETLTAYEVGVKAELFDRRVRFNNAAYLYKYDDLQVFVLDNRNLIPVARKTNGGDATIYGLETDLTAKLTPELDLVLAAALTHSEYDVFLDGGRSYAGNQLVNAPKFAASAALDFARDLGGGTLKAHLDAAYQSDVFYTPANSPAFGQRGYTLVNARLGWSWADRWSVALWARNIFDKRYLVDATPGIGADLLHYAEPRTYGVELSYSY